MQAGRRQACTALLLRGPASATSLREVHFDAAPPSAGWTRGTWRERYWPAPYSLTNLHNYSSSPTRDSLIPPEPFYAHAAFSPPLHPQPRRRGPQTRSHQRRPVYPADEHEDAHVAVAALEHRQSCGCRNPTAHRLAHIPLTVPSFTHAWRSRFPAVQFLWRIERDNLRRNPTR